MYLGIFLSLYMWHFLRYRLQGLQGQYDQHWLVVLAVPSLKNEKNIVNGFRMKSHIRNGKIWKNNPNVLNHQPDIHDYTNDRYGLCMYMANIDRYTSTLACQKIARRENRGTCIKGTCKQPDIWVYVPVMRRQHRLLTGTHIKARGFRRTEVYHVFILHINYTIVLISIYNIAAHFKKKVV